MTTARLRSVSPAPPVVVDEGLENARAGLYVRPRTEADNEFIQRITEQELVPTLERAWQFKWDRGHARKFMLDLLTIGRTLVATLPEDAPSDRGDKIVAPEERRAAYVWYVIRPRQWRPFPQRIFWINYLVVAAEFQGRGLGARIVEHCIEAARDAGCTSMELWVQTENTAARRFYEGLKFIPLQAAHGNVHMRKRLR